MPKEDGVGFSEYTRTKIAHLGKIFAMHMRVTQAVLNRPNRYIKQYRYIDLTSGKGFTPDGTKGSPLMFLDQAWAEEFKIPFRADLIEHNRKNISQLESAITAEAAKNNRSVANLYFHCGDYQRKVGELLPTVDTSELGLVYVDPSGDLPGFDVLHYVAEVRPRMEILIYLSTTNVKRLFPHTRKFLSDHMSAVGKKHWLFQKPLARNPFKWTFLLGSNTPIFKEYKSINLLSLDSDAGQDFFQQVDLTKKQYQDLIQPKLPEL